MNHCSLSPSEIEFLKEKYAEGMACTVIAWHLRCSNHTVIRNAHKLGLERVEITSFDRRARAKAVIDYHLTYSQRLALGYIARDGLNSDRELADAMSLTDGAASPLYKVLAKHGLIATRRGRGQSRRREVLLTCPKDLALALVPPKQDIEPTPAPTDKTRKCLMCPRSFKSTWAGERICRRCKDTEAWRTGQDFEARVG